MALYDKLVSPADTSDMPDDVARDVPANGMKFIAANGLQNAGDQVINPKTVLPWLLTAQGAPGLAIALLVPDGEAGTTHIKLLSKTAVLLMDDAFKEMVRSSNDADQIAAAINEKLEEE